METLLEKAWQIAVICIGGLTSLLLYRKKQEDEWKAKIDKQMNTMQVKQSACNSSVNHLIKSVDRIEKFIMDNNKD